MKDIVRAYQPFPHGSLYSNHLPYLPLTPITCTPVCLTPTHNLLIPNFHSRTVPLPAPFSPSFISNSRDSRQTTIG
ncbi:hypothetical protein BGY98DRAFT_1009697 [Russula aff. rugulosa BPL654]|nr:hypothetical protein BGY98DRAFT_1009697 [Russula aff. rugulosa BPL654]